MIDESEAIQGRTRDEGRKTVEIARNSGGEAAAGASLRHPLIELTLARIKEFLREKEAVFWVFVFPVLLALALGIAFRSSGPEKLPVAIESGAPDHLIRALSENPELQVDVLDESGAARALRTGKVAVVVRAGSGDASYDFRFDPTRPESKTARLAVDDALQRALGRKDIVQVRDETVTEPGARYIDFLVPGLVGMNLMGSGLWGLGFVVVQARTRKLLKRLAATPMRRSHFLLSFMFSRLAFLVMEVLAVVGFAWLVFGVSVHGSIIDLAIVSLIGAMAFAGIGLLVAARPKTIEGVSGLMNLVMLPMWLLSGTFFSSERFPQFLQPFIKALPLTALNDSLRSVMNDGASLSASWPAIAIMALWGVVSFLLALRLFRWQ
jgi:ABC-type multidrug transport system permease subunit